jgi:hypothetical protein
VKTSVRLKRSQVSIGFMVIVISTLVLKATSCGKAGVLCEETGVKLEDLNAWVEAFVEGKLISPEMKEEQQRFVPWPDVSQLGVEAGYGLGMTDLDGIYGHGGNDPGYNTAMYYLPGEKTAFVGFNNVLPGPTQTRSAALQLELLLFDSADIMFPGSVRRTEQ